MKKILVLAFISSTLLFSASSDTNDSEKQKRIEKQLKIEMEKEQKYAREQTFYNQYNYNFKRSEVNEDTLKYVPELEVDDLDMDNVYD